MGEARTPTTKCISEADSGEIKRLWVSLFRGKHRSSTTQSKFLVPGDALRKYLSRITIDKKFMPLFRNVMWLNKKSGISNGLKNAPMGHNL